MLTHSHWLCLLCGYFSVIFHQSSVSQLALNLTDHCVPRAIRTFIYSAKLPTQHRLLSYRVYIRLLTQHGVAWEVGWVYLCQKFVDSPVVYILSKYFQFWILNSQLVFLLLIVKCFGRTISKDFSKYKQVESHNITDISGESLQIKFWTLHEYSYVSFTKGAHRRKRSKSTPLQNTNQIHSS